MSIRLANALSQRSDLQGRLDALRVRLEQNSKVQEGDTPAEDPQALLTEMDEDFAELEALIVKINLTNSKVQIQGRTITEWIAARDCLKKKISMLRSFLNEASDKIDRYSQKEIRIVSTVNVAQLQKQLDELCRELREVTDIIEEANWTTDLLEN